MARASTLPPVLLPQQPAKRRLGWRIVRWLLIAAIWAVLAFAVMLVWFARDLPRPEAALDAARRPGLTLEDRNGHRFATFGDVVGDPLRLADLPRWMPQAVVSPSRIGGSGPIPASTFSASAVRCS